MFCSMYFRATDGSHPPSAGRWQTCTQTQVAGTCLLLTSMLCRLFPAAPALGTGRVELCSRWLNVHSDGNEVSRGWFLVLPRVTELQGIQ